MFLIDPALVPCVLIVYIHNIATWAVQMVNTLCMFDVLASN